MSFGLIICVGLMYYQQIYKIINLLLFVLVWTLKH